MLDVAEKLQDKYDRWFEELIQYSTWLNEGEDINEDKAFELFWFGMSAEDASGALQYED